MASRDSARSTTRTHSDILSRAMHGALIEIHSQTPRVVGTTQSKLYADMLSPLGPPLCPRLGRVVAEQVANRAVALDLLEIYPLRLRSVIRAARRVRPPTLAEACEREQLAHCRLDPLQIHAMATGHLSDWLALRPGLAVQVGATVDLVDAIDAAERSAGLAGSGMRLAR